VKTKPTMALVASSISGAAYVLNNNEDKDTGNGFEVGSFIPFPRPHRVFDSLVVFAGLGLFSLGCANADDTPVYTTEEMASVVAPRTRWIRLVLPQAHCESDQLGWTIRRPFVDVVAESDMEGGCAHPHH
jgi:hypothetical protein